MYRVAAEGSGKILKKSYHLGRLSIKIIKLSDTRIDCLTILMISEKERVSKGPDYTIYLAPY